MNTPDSLRAKRGFSPFVLAAVLLVASGCSSLRRGIEDGPDLPTLGNSDHVKVQIIWSGADPYPTAARYCAQFGRYASPRDMSPTWASFNCVLDSDGGTSEK
jgi:hypothetical protein